GFGAGAFFFAPLAKGLITGGKYQILGASLFGLPKVGVFNTFMALGTIFLVAIVLGAQLLRNPPAGFKPAGWTPPQPRAGVAPAKTDYTPGQMLATPQFWLLWLTYFAGCTAGLQVIMKASPVWQSCAIGVCTPPVSSSVFGAIGSAAAMAVSILAIFNAVGRIFWGRVSDGIGRKTTLIIMLTICAAAMFALDFFRAYGLYIIGISVVGLCFGGYLALFPAFTADFFGTKHYGINYGWMFSAYGAGGIVGPFLAAALMKVSAKVSYQVTDAAGTLSEKAFTVGNYRPAFFVAAAMCVAAVLLTLLIKPPKHD
ncbi:MFS transporter, partial [candidate division WOR-3 bacterium]|nr:MFS transporter [candidate division WOR-3 bacterium]